MGEVLERNNIRGWLDALRAGGTLRGIAAAVGLTPQAVGRRLRDLPEYQAIMAKRRHPPHGSEIIRQARYLWDVEGLSASAVGRRMGLSKNAIVGLARRHDFKDRPPPMRGYSC